MTTPGRVCWNPMPGRRPWVACWYHAETHTHLTGWVPGHRRKGHLGGRLVRLPRVKAAATFSLFT